MTRNWIKVIDRKGKPHILNMTDIIDIFDQKELNYYTIICVDSHFIDILPESYQNIIDIMKPATINNYVEYYKQIEDVSNDTILARSLNLTGGKDGE